MSMETDIKRATNPSQHQCKASRTKQGSSGLVQNSCLIPPRTTNPWAGNSAERDRQQRKHTAGPNPWTSFIKSRNAKTNGDTGTHRPNTTRKWGINSKVRKSQKQRANSHFCWGNYNGEAKDKKNIIHRKRLLLCTVKLSVSKKAPPARILRLQKYKQFCKCKKTLSHLQNLSEQYNRYV